MSASIGNVYIVQDVLKYIEPEEFSFYYTKKPAKQRDLDLRNIQLLVEEYELAERAFNGGEVTESRKENLIRSYELCTPNPKKMRKPGYTFCSMIAQTLHDEDKQLAALERTKQLSKPTAEEKKFALRRIEKAGKWARDLAPETFKVEVSQEIPTHVTEALSKGQLAALKAISEMPVEEMRTKFKEIAEANGLKPSELFEACYLVLLGKSRGPRLIEFISTLDKNFVTARFRMEK